MAAGALDDIGQIYHIEAEARGLTAKKRQQLRQTWSAPIIDALYDWLIEQRQ